MKNAQTFVDGKTQEIYCERCGQREWIPFPMAISVFVELVEYFNVRHKDCAEPEKCTFGGHENFIPCPACHGEKQ